MLTKNDNSWTIPYLGKQRQRMEMSMNEVNELLCSLCHDGRREDRGNRHWPVKSSLEMYAPSLDSLSSQKLRCGPTLEAARQLTFLAVFHAMKYVGKKPR